MAKIHSMALLHATHLLPQQRLSMRHVRRTPLLAQPLRRHRQLLNVRHRADLRHHNQHPLLQQQPRWQRLLLLAISEHNRTMRLRELEVQGGIRKINGPLSNKSPYRVGTIPRTTLTSTYRTIPRHIPQQPRCRISLNNRMFLQWLLKLKRSSIHPTSRLNSAKCNNIHLRKGSLYQP